MESRKDIWPLGDIRPYPGNPRVIPQEAVDAVAESIERFGLRKPIVVDSLGVVIAGHTRLLALQKLGHVSAWVRVASDLTPEQVRQYRLVDNRVGELTWWDMDALSVEVASMFEEFGDGMELAGFGADEVAVLTMLDEEAHREAPAGTPAPAPREPSERLSSSVSILTFYVPREAVATVKPQIEAVIAEHVGMEEVANGD